MRDYVLNASLHQHRKVVLNVVVNEIHYLLLLLKRKLKHLRTILNEIQ